MDKQPKKEKVIIFPNKVRKMMLRNCVQDALLANYYSIVHDTNYFSASSTAFWLLGLDYHRLNENLCNELCKVYEKYSITRYKSVGFSEALLTELADKIIKEWKEIIAINKLSKKLYEDED